MKPNSALERPRARGWLGVVLVLAACGTTFVAGAQPARKIPRIGYLHSGTAPGALDDLERAFSTMRQERVQALVVINSPLVLSRSKRIVDLAAESRLPAMYWESRWVDAGGLMSYGPSYVDLWRRAASYVDKILKGARPSDLPIEQPTKFDLVINLKTAKALGLTIPPSLLLRADQMIER